MEINDYTRDIIECLEPEKRHPFVIFVQIPKYHRTIFSPEQSQRAENLTAWLDQLVAERQKFKEQYHQQFRLFCTERGIQLTEEQIQTGLECYILPLSKEQTILLERSGLVKSIYAQQK